MVLLSYNTLQNTLYFAKYKTWNFFIYSEENKIEAVCEQIGISQQRKGALLPSFIISLLSTRPLYGAIT